VLLSKKIVMGELFEM